MEECSNFHQKNLTWSDCMLFYKLMEALRWGTKCDTTVTQLLLPKCLFWIELTLQTVDLQELTRKKFGRFKTSPVHASIFFPWFQLFLPFALQAEIRRTGLRKRMEIHSGRWPLASRLNGPDWTPHMFSMMNSLTVSAGRNSMSNPSWLSVKTLKADGFLVLLSLAPICRWDIDNAIGIFHWCNWNFP